MTFFLFWSSDISQHSCWQWSSSLTAATLLLGFWVPNLCDSVPPSATVISLGGFLPTPVHFFLCQSLESVFGNLSTSPEIPPSDTNYKPGYIPSSQRWDERTSGLHWTASPSQGPWADKVTAHLFPRAHPGFRKQGRQSRPNPVLVYESELPGRHHNLHVTLKLEENVISVSVILIAKCARTILLPHWEALSLWWRTCLQWEGSVLCRFHSTA